eukprot:2756987-Rhodomonas_salina.1
MAMFSCVKRGHVGAAITQFELRGLEVMELKVCCPIRLSCSPRFPALTWICGTAVRRAPAATAGRALQGARTPPFLRGSDRFNVRLCRGDFGACVPRLRRNQQERAQLEPPNSRVRNRVLGGWHGVKVGRVRWGWLAVTGRGLHHADAGAAWPHRPAPRRPPHPPRHVRPRQDAQLR